MFAQSEPGLFFAIFAGVFAFMVCFWAILLAKRFKRCPNNRLLVVFGQGVPGGMHVQHGGARLVWPLIQDYAYLSLDPIKAAFTDSSAFTRESIRVRIMGDVVFAIGTEATLMGNASERLLGLDAAGIRRVGEDESAAAIRDLAGQLSVEMIHRDRDRFAAELKQLLDERLHQYGLIAISVRIGDISDEGGVIDGIQREERNRLDERAKEDAAIVERRRREEAEFNARRAKAEAELEERHRREIEQERLKRQSPQDVLKDDSGEALKNM